jgi:hypothetical protein
MPRRIFGLVAVLLLATGLWLIGDHSFGQTEPEVRVSTGVPVEAAALPSESSAGTSASVEQSPPTIPDRSGTPVRIVIPFASRNHPQGVTADISADSLLPNGELFVPEDPRKVSWSREDAAPGAPQGTAILTAHIDYAGVTGAFSDLAEYAHNHVGKNFTVLLADGRQLTYRITGGAEYNKDQLAAHPELRQQLYDQTSAFGPAPGTGRLLLVSCGGAFDNSTGNYEDNVFLFAMPVTGP